MRDVIKGIPDAFLAVCLLIVVFLYFAWHGED